MHSATTVQLRVTVPRSQPVPTTWQAPHILLYCIIYDRPSSCLEKLQEGAAEAQRHVDRRSHKAGAPHMQDIKKNESGPPPEFCFNREISGSCDHFYLFCLDPKNKKPLKKAVITVSLLTCNCRSMVYFKMHRFTISMASPLKALGENSLFCSTPRDPVNVAQDTKGSRGLLHRPHMTGSCISGRGGGGKYHTLQVPTMKSREWLCRQIVLGLYHSLGNFS